MAVTTDALGTDLAFDDDFQISPSGDFDTISGIENVRRSIFRRIITVPGTLIHRPNYGCGLVAFQGAPVTLDIKRQIAHKIATNLPLDPRISKVTNVSVNAEDGTPDTLVVTVSVVIAVYGEVTFTFTPFTQVVV
jgi:phage baseplate assembly protein W